MTWMVSIVRLSGSGRVAWMDSSLSQKLQMFFVSLSCLHFSSSLKSRSSIQRQRNDRLWIISPSLNCCPCRVHSDSSIWIFQHARRRRLEHPPWWYASVFVAASFNVCIYLWSMHYCCLRVICACLFAQTLFGWKYDGSLRAASRQHTDRCRTGGRREPSADSLSQQPHTDIHASGCLSGSQDESGSPVCFSKTSHGKRREIKWWMEEEKVKQKTNVKEGKEGAGDELNCKGGRQKGRTEEERKWGDVPRKSSASYSCGELWRRCRLLQLPRLLLRAFYLDTKLSSLVSSFVTFAASNERLNCAG